tara:strand:- start:540 stop:644 length:105 start_codon:yes stop_codon:yes gene_type:complete
MRRITQLVMFAIVAATALFWLVAAMGGVPVPLMP